MSRNKVKNAHSLQGAAVLKWIVVGTFFCVLLGSYVACKNKVLRLAAEVHQQDVELDTWKRRNDQMRCAVAGLTSLGELQRKVASMGNQLVSISELEVHRSDSTWEGSRNGIPQSGLQRDRQTLITSATTGAVP